VRLAIAGLQDKKAGSPIARHYDPKMGHLTLGSADDCLEADGADTLTFVQVRDRARVWFEQLGKNDGKTVEPLTVRAAYGSSLVDYRARGGKAPGSIETTFRAHILPALGDRLVSDLTAQAIRQWHRGLATSAPRLRSSAKAAQHRPRKLAPTDADSHRARRATANAILTLLKAALNLAYREEGVLSDDPWRQVRPFQKVGAARVRYRRFRPLRQAYRRSRAQSSFAATASSNLQSLLGVQATRFLMVHIRDPAAASAGNQTGGVVPRVPPDGPRPPLHPCADGGSAPCRDRL